jgi:hypothetical protein
MDPFSFASTLFFGFEVRLLTYIRPLNNRIGFSMLGHDGLFARQFPIGLSGFTASLTLGFFQRRFDLFAIVQFAMQS